VVVCVCSIGVVYGEQGRLEEALAQYRLAQAMLQAVAVLPDGWSKVIEALHMLVERVNKKLAE
jgi:hypothetical protein